MNKPQQAGFATSGDQSEERFRTIFENAPVMIDSFDREGRCLLWNRECVRRLGFTKQEVQESSDPLGLCYPDPAVRERALKNIKRADGVFREYRVRTKDGDYRTQLWADFRLPDDTVISVGHDVTEREQADRARNESEEKYRQIFNEAHDGIVLIDFETGFVAECNPEFEAQCGRRLHELRTMTVREIASPESREACKQLIYDVMANGAGSTVTTLLKPNGQTLDADVRARRIAINGRSYMQGLVRDITGEWAVARALQDSEERYRSIFNEARDGIALADRDGFIVDCNPEFERQTGRTLAELRGMRAWELRPGPMMEEARGLFEESRRRGWLGPVEQSYEKPNGEILPVEVNTRQITLGGRRLIQKISRDISQRKAAAAALREKDARLRLIVEQTPAVLWTTDNDLCFTSSEGSALESIGLCPGEVVGKTLSEFFETDDPDFLPIAVHRQALKGVSASYETEWAGHVFESHAEPLRDQDGAIIGTIGVAMDITQRKLAEQQLKESEQKLRALALRLQKVRDDESATLAREFHDEIGQSLSALKMDIGWIQRRVDEMDHTQDCEPVMDRLRSMSADVDATIKKVRAISTELRPVILDHAGLLRALEWQTRVFQDRTGIECKFKNEASGGHELDRDRSTAVFRIFQELLTNIARHAHAEHVDIELHQEEDSLVLDVSDDGRGIQQDDLKGFHALGILGMRERAIVCGGDLSIGRRNGNGTRVVVKIPMTEVGRANEDPHR